MRCASVISLRTTAVSGRSASSVSWSWSVPLMDH